MKEPRYPRGECVWVVYQNASEEILFILTSKDNNRDWYYLYQLENGEFKKLGRARTPTELEEKYGVVEAMHGTQKKRQRKSTKKKTDTE